MKFWEKSCIIIANNQRQSKTVNGVTTEHIWDGENIVVDMTGDSINKYYRGATGLAFADLDGNISYYQKDAHGDITALTNAEGVITQSYIYDAFGNSNAEADANPFRYCGEYQDFETGNIYLRNRYYDPSIGRFISEDPHWNIDNMIYSDYTDEDNPVPDIDSITQSTNLYVYAMNNPIGYFDPSGLVAGERFSSPDEAAKDWAWNYYGESYYVGFESASIIYMDWDEKGNIFYSYTYAVWGEPHSVIPGDAMKFLPDGAVAFSVIHSHPNSPDFSSADRNYATSQNWSVYVVIKASDGVDIKKWADTRQGYKESTIVTNQTIAQLSSERKQDLKNEFQAEWKSHVKNGCPQGFKCEHKKWPRT